MEYNIPEVQVSYHSGVQNSKKVVVSNSQDAYDVFIDLFNPDTLQLYEELHVLFLNRGNVVLGSRKLGIGTSSAILVNIKLIMSIALKTASSAFIIAHNHPSGRVHPSTEDTKITNRLRDASKLLDLVFIDHLIVSSDDYYSYADEGKLN